MTMLSCRLSWRYYSPEWSVVPRLSHDPSLIHDGLGDSNFSFSLEPERMSEFDVLLEKKKDRLSLNLKTFSSLWVTQ